MANIMGMTRAPAAGSSGSGSGSGSGGIMGAISGVVSGIGRLFSGSGSKNSDPIGDLIKTLPGFASGGFTGGRRPILVGEAGPEIFVPQSAGNIMPNSALGGNTQVTYNISAVDAKSVAQLFAENRKTLLGTIRQAEKELPFRGI
jgi:hypothetical protein